MFKPEIRKLLKKELEEALLVITRIVLDFVKLFVWSLFVYLIDQLIKNSFFPVFFFCKPYIDIIHILFIAELSIDIILNIYKRIIKAKNLNRRGRNKRSPP